MDVAPEKAAQFGARARGTALCARDLEHHVSGAEFDGREYYFGRNSESDNQAHGCLMISSIGIA
jgi:hypothetical protein